MRDQAHLSRLQVDTLYLDTTYALPKHIFPPQQQAIASMVQVRDSRGQSQLPGQFCNSAASVVGHAALGLGEELTLQQVCWGSL